MIRASNAFIFYTPSVSRPVFSIPPSREYSNSPAMTLSLRFGDGFGFGQNLGSMNLPCLNIVGEAKQWIPNELPTTISKGFESFGSCLFR